MNYDDDKKIDNVTPYKATGNLNTAISNPTVHINDAMNMNIKSVNTVQNNNAGVSTPDNIPVTNNYNTMNLNNASNMPNVNNNVIAETNNQNVNNINVKKTYVTTDNKSKKKKLNLNLTKEFKIALLIIVILFVFVFILDLLPKLF